MNYDPFEDNTPATNDTVTETANTKESLVAQNEGKIVVTLKGGAGYDAPWIVVHANDSQDALNQLRDDVLKELITRTKEVATYFSGGNARPAQAQQQTQQGPPQGATEAPGGEKRYCAHGEMRFKSDISKAGKPYKGFFCTERDRSQQCDAQFIR